MKAWVSSGGQTSNQSRRFSKAGGGSLAAIIWDVPLPQIFLKLLGVPRLGLFCLTLPLQGLDGLKLRLNPGMLALL